jgi:hypothetical protein
MKNLIVILASIILFSTSIFGVNLQSGISIKPDPYSHVTISIYQSSCKKIELANTNKEREQIYEEAMAYIEEEFATIEEFYSPDKEESLKIKEQLKNVLTEQLIRYNTYPRWILRLGKLMGFVPWYIYK